MDDVETGSLKAGAGFWNRGTFNLSAPGSVNPWRLATNMAPFDQEVDRSSQLFIYSYF